MDHSGGVSARSGLQTSLANSAQEPTAAYSTKTFYSNYIGANSLKGTTTNSQTNSFVKKSRNSSYSTMKVDDTTNNTRNKVGGAKHAEMKASQTQSHLTQTSGINLVGPFQN